MSDDWAIKVEGLGKRYSIAADRGRYTSLRDVLSQGARSAASRLLGRGGGSPKREPFWALKDVSFEVPRGECVGVIGRNGAGKSTLLKVLSRITEPTEGDVQLRGRVGSLLEVGTGFHPELTGRENVFLNGAILGMTRKEIARKFDEIASFAEVERFLDTPVKHYSSGMYTRLAFAVAAHLEPEILIVDEVLAVGDAEFQKKCLGKMGEVAKGGRTVLFVSHNMSAIKALCASAIYLKQGRVAAKGSVRDLVQIYLDDAASLQEAVVGRGAKLVRDIRLVAIGVSPTSVTSGDDCTLTVEVEATADTVIDHLCTIINDKSESRVAVIDHRHAEGAYRLSCGHRLSLSAKISPTPTRRGRI